MATKLATKSFILMSFFLLSLTSSKARELATSAPHDHDVFKDVKAGTTHIHFYFHDIVSGSNPTVHTVTPPASGSTTTFGKTSIMDDKLTDGPDFSSTEVGRAQGLYAGSSLSELGLLQALNLVFTGGPYSGSSITVLGRNTPLRSPSELSVVGGTGQFRFARGYAIAKNYMLNFGTGNAIVEYDVYVTTN